MEHSKQLTKIDLINFDDPQFTECRYILTSPRSLKACSMLHIEPIDLLPVPFEEFRKQIPRVTFDKAKKLYDSAERRRNDNVRRARIERNRLLNVYPDGDSTAPTRADTNPLIAGVLGRSISKSAGTFSLPSSNPGEDSLDGNLHQETTSAASETGQSDKRHPTKPSRFTHQRPSTGGEFTVRRSSNTERRSVEKRGARSASLDGASKKKDNKSLKTTSPQKMRKALNYSSAVLEEQQRSKDPVSRIQERVLLDSKQPSYSRPLHLTRSHDATSDTPNRLWTPEEWEKEIQLSNARRAQMLEQNRRELKRLEEKYQREMEEQENLIIKEKELAEKEEKHRKLLEEEHRRLEAKLQEHREHVKHRRARIAENLQQQQQELERYHMDLLKDAEESLKRAQQERLRQELLEQERRKLENRLRGEEMWRRKLRVASDMDIANQNLRQTLEVRDQKVSENQEKMHSQKDQALKDSQKERLRREQEIAVRRELMNLEEAKFREDLKRYQESTFQKAEDKITSKNVDEQRRLRDARLAKENAQKTKYEQLLALEREWKADVDSILRYKDEKAAKIQQEMQARMDESRSIAKAAEQLREEIRAAYRMDSFDKKVQQVNLINKMGLGSD